MHGGQWQDFVNACHGLHLAVVKSLHSAAQFRVHADHRKQQAGRAHITSKHRAAIHFRADFNARQALAYECELRGCFQFDGVGSRLLRG